ncbi:MAG: exodeoxyribonuclease VII large subunit [Bacteroidales bacterium]|nr:exodeoxyribonuclease VII large subunit [Bacteroidales bacterium]
MAESYINLSELVNDLGEVLEEAFPDLFWVKAEVSSLKDSSGHCYMELIENNPDTGRIAAKIGAVCWRSAWAGIKTSFRARTGKFPEVGMTLLLNVALTHHPVHGLSLQVHELDANFTLGEQERIRLQTIERLRKEGMFDLNTALSLPVLPRRLAVISARTAAGFGDFCRQLGEREYGFHIELFEAPMQGESAPSGICEALDRISEKVGEGWRYDLVLIMRGGGSDFDLACFDDYGLCCHVAQFPLPVLVAVGHDRDHHIVDDVAAVSVKTPTAAAEHLLFLLDGEVGKIDSFAQRLALALKNKLIRSSQRIDALENRLKMSLQMRFSTERSRLDIFESRLRGADPARLLEKGFAIACHNGQRIDSVEGLEKGNRLTIIMKDGRVEVVVDRLLS